MAASGTYAMTVGAGVARRIVTGNFGTFYGAVAVPEGNNTERMRYVPFDIRGRFRHVQIGHFFHVIS